MSVQSALVAAGFPLTLDGIIGPNTYTAILSFASKRSLGPLGVALGAAMAVAFPASAITSDLQVCHWIAQATHETEEFRYLTELGGSSYFVRYDGRADLGNTKPGDGFTYRGRGIFQITGRWNYAHYGAELGLPLEANPALAAQPDVAVKIACAFWTEHHIGAVADDDNVVTCSREGVLLRLDAGPELHNHLGGPHAAVIFGLGETAAFGILWSILTSKLAGPIASAAAVVLAFALFMAHHDLGHVTKELAVASRDLGTARASVENLTAGIDTQNAAVARLQADGVIRSLKAAQAVQQAHAVTVALNKREATIAAMKATPDECADALAALKGGAQ